MREPWGDLASWSSHIFGAEPCAEEVEDHAPGGERWNGEERTHNPRQGSARNHPQEDDDRRHFDSVGLNVGGQEIALELLDGEEHERSQNQRRRRDRERH